MNKLTHKKQQGFSLIEVLIGSTILSFVLMFVASALTMETAMRERNERIQQLTALGERVIETIRDLPYAEIEAYPYEWWWIDDPSNPLYDKFDIVEHEESYSYDGYEYYDSWETSEIYETLMDNYSWCDIIVDDYVGNPDIKRVTVSIWCSAPPNWYSENVVSLTTLVTKNGINPAT